MRRLRSEVLAASAAAEAMARRAAVDPLAVHKRGGEHDPQLALGELAASHPLGMKGGTQEEQAIAALLVGRAAPQPWLFTLIPHGGPGDVLVERTRYMQQTRLDQITVTPSGDVFFSDVVEKHRATFERVILWVPEEDLDGGDIVRTEQEYVLRAYELTSTGGGKLVAAVSTDLAEDRGFRVWANGKKATFDTAASLFLRERGLVLMTIWKS